MSGYSCSRPKLSQFTYSYGQTAWNDALHIPQMRESTLRQTPHLHLASFIEMAKPSDLPTWRWDITKYSPAGWTKRHFTWSEKRAVDTSININPLANYLMYDDCTLLHATNRLITNYLLYWKRYECFLTWPCVVIYSLQCPDSWAFDVRTMHSVTCYNEAKHTLLTVLANVWILMDITVRWPVTINAVPLAVSLVYEHCTVLLHVIGVVISAWHPVDVTHSISCKYSSYSSK